jgi:hypothetical protein
MTEVFTISSPAMPCSGWNVDVGCCPDWDTYDASLQTAAAEYGAFTVWAATGRRFGVCPRTVRPCGKTCSNQGIYGYYWSEGTWMPYILNGEWRNFMCGCGCCQPACQVWLPGPVASITSVTLDGSVVDPSTYRVDNGQWLVRTHDASVDDCWPVCQDYNLDTGTNTFFVEYMQGYAVPSILQRAAGELACEWVKSCLGLPCRLPQRVTSVARQGVSITMVSVEELLRHGLTGVQTVDQVIRNFNPYGLVSRMGISSPDDPVVRYTTWP